MPEILVIGSSNLDWAIKVDRTPQIGETVIASSVDKTAGGKGANQAFACAKLGAVCSFLSVLGNDDAAQTILKNMNSVGVDVSGIKVKNNINTGAAFICVEQSGNNCIVIAQGSNAYCSESYLKGCDEYFKQCSIILLQMEIPLNAVEYAICRAHELNKTIILNPAPASPHFKKELYHLINYITPNETELAILSGIPVTNTESAIEAAKELVKLGAKNVIATLGENGAVWVTSEHVYTFKAPFVNAVDTTAAGDTFNAAFACKISQGESTREAIKYAVYASSLCVSRAGAQSAVPSACEVLEFERSRESKRIKS